MLPKPTRFKLGILGLAVAISGYGSRAQGDERLVTAKLDWSAPKGSRCPTAASMIKAVESRLSRSVFVEDSRPDVRLIVRLEPSGSTWSTRLDLLDSQDAPLGTRYLRSASSNCAALSDVLPVVIALLLDASRPSVRLDLPEPAYHPLPTPPEASVIDSRDEIAQTQPGNRPLGVGWLVRAEATYGLLPGIAPGVSLVGFVEPASLRMPIEFWIGALSPGLGHEEREVRLSLVYAGLGLCPALWRGSLNWSVCSGLTAGNLQSFGRGFDVNQSATNLHVDVRAASVLDVPIARPWFARFEAGAIFPLIRRRFVGEPEPGARTVLHRPNAMVPQLAIGIGVRFQ